MAISGSYQIPVGRGRTYLNKTNGFVDAIVGGWQAQTILVVRSGTPYTPIISSDRANTGVGSQRPNLNPAGGNPQLPEVARRLVRQIGYVVSPILYLRPGACQYSCAPEPTTSSTPRSSRTSRCRERARSLSAQSSSTSRTPSASTHPAMSPSTMPQPDRSPVPQTRRDRFSLHSSTTSNPTRIHLLQFAHFRETIFFVHPHRYGGKCNGAGGHSSGSTRLCLNRRQPSRSTWPARSVAYKPIYSWFGYDEANYTTMRNGKALLRDLHDLSPVPVYIRAHHLLTSGDGKAELKFSSTNVYTEDAFRQAGLRLQNSRRHLRRVQSRGRSAHGRVRLHAQGSRSRPAGSS